MRDFEPLGSVRRQHDRWDGEPDEGGGASDGDRLEGPVADDD